MAKKKTTKALREMGIIPLYNRYRNVMYRAALKGSIDLDADNRAYALYIGGNVHPLAKDMSHDERIEALASLVENRKGISTGLSKPQLAKAKSAYHRLYLDAIR